MEGDFSPRKLKIAAAILIGQTFATSILPFSAFTLLMLPMTHQFGWSRTDFSFATTFLFIFGAASLWPIGRIADKVGVRPVILIGTTIVGLLTLAMSLQTRSLWQLYGYYTLLGMFGSTGVAYSKVAAVLFTQNRGKALAILGAESTVAAAGIPLLTNWLILDYGWRTMYVVFGAIILAVVPVLFFTIEEPGQVGIHFRPRWRRHAGPASPARAARPARPPRLEGMMLKEALHDGVFWLITAASVAGMVIATGMIAHMVPALIGKGFSQTLAAEMISVFTLVGVAGALAGGYMADRFETAKVGVPFSLLSAGSAFLLMIVTSSYGGALLLVLAMALGGFSFGAARPMGQYFHTRFFGLGSFTEIVSFQYLITNPISAFSAPIIGMIYARTHSYQLPFLLMAISPLIGGIVWLVLPKYRYSAHIGEMPAPRPAAKRAAAGSANKESPPEGGKPIRRASSKCDSAGSSPARATTHR
ncbi:MAG: MFS transporter [Steroidobacteraceae bacterium]